MKRLIFDHIEVEITRRCNLKCAHCMRGDAQNIDMSNETIDRLLNMTDEIYTLAFTGGEPTLNVAGMNHFLDKMIENKIAIHKFAVIINGTQSDELCGFIKRLSSYMDSIDHGKDESGIMIAISADVFHEEQGINADEAFNYYNDKLGDCAMIIFDDVGNFPKRIGRASNFDYGMTIYNENSDCAVEYATTNQKHYCFKNADYYRTIKDNQLAILCEMYISVNGDVIHRRKVPDASYYDIDNAEKLFNINESNLDVEQKINKYNIGKTKCIEYVRFGSDVKVWIENSLKDNSVIQNFYEESLPTYYDILKNYQKANTEDYVKKTFSDYKNDCKDKKKLILLEVKEQYPNLPNKQQIELANSFYMLKYCSDILSADAKNRHTIIINDIIRNAKTNIRPPRKQVFFKNPDYVIYPED